MRATPRASRPRRRAEGHADRPNPRPCRPRGARAPRRAAARRSRRAPRPAAPRRAVRAAAGRRRAPALSTNSRSIAGVSQATASHSPSATALVSAPLTWTRRRPGFSALVPVPITTRSPSSALTAKAPIPPSALSPSAARRRPRPGASSESASSTLVLPAPFSPTSRLSPALPSSRVASWLRKRVRVIRSSVMGSGSLGKFRPNATRKLSADSWWKIPTRGEAD